MRMLYKFGSREIIWKSILKEVKDQTIRILRFDAALPV